MKRLAIVTTLILLCFTLPAQAIQLSPEWITDMSGQITPQTKKSVNELSQTFQREHSLGLYTLVVNGTENGLDAHRYIQQVFAENQLSSKDTLVLLDIASRHAEILSGVDSQVSDSIVKSAIAKAKPMLILSDWNAGTIALVVGVTELVVNVSAIWMILGLLLLFLVIASFCPPSSGSSSGGGYYSDSSGSSSGGGSGGDSF